MSNPEYVIRQPEEDGEAFEDDCLSRAESADTRSTVSHSNGSLRYQSEIGSLYDVSHPPRFSYSPYAPPPHPSMNQYAYPYDFNFLPPPPFPSASLSTIVHQAQGICNCAQCLHTRRKYVETQAIPSKKETPSGIMCCYHKRGVCKKGSDCWYSHDGNVDTPCHYGVKCVAGHAAYAKTALRGSSSIAAAVPLHIARAPPAPPTRRSHQQPKATIPSAPIRADVLEYVEDDESEFTVQPVPAPPAPTPVKTTPKAKQQNETIPEPPTLEGETCKYCEHNGLYVMPYRLYPGNGPSLLQYRIHCNACGGSWTPSSLVEEPTQEKRNRTRDQQVA